MRRKYNKRRKDRFSKRKVSRRKYSKRRYSKRRVSRKKNHNKYKILYGGAGEDDGELVYGRYKFGLKSILSQSEKGETISEADLEFLKSVVDHASLPKKFQPTIRGIIDRETGEGAEPKPPLPPPEELGEWGNYKRRFKKICLKSQGEGPLPEQDLKFLQSVVDHPSLPQKHREPTLEAIARETKKRAKPVPSSAPGPPPQPSEKKAPPPPPSDPPPSPDPAILDKGWPSYRSRYKRICQISRERPGQIPEEDFLFLQSVVDHSSLPQKFQEPTREAIAREIEKRAKAMREKKKRSKGKKKKSRKARPTEAAGAARPIYEPLKQKTVDGQLKYILEPIQVSKEDYGSRLLTETEIEAEEYEPKRNRIRVLRDTLTMFERESITGSFYTAALENLERWQTKRQASGTQDRFVIHLMGDDWGNATLEMTKKYGQIFAVLNMANAYSPGGGYTHGCAAQEENMFRRSDCHFSIHRARDLHHGRRYKDNMQELINGEHGEVYLDTQCPRVCIKGPESQSRDGSGYHLLQETDLFLFFELRSAAINLKHGWENHDVEPRTRDRIEAQLDTLIAKGVRHVVLSAFGCGAFHNDPALISQIYVEELGKRIEHFDVVAFAIYNAGYDPQDNFGKFVTVFRSSNLRKKIVLMPSTGDGSSSSDGGGATA